MNQNQQLKNKNRLKNFFMNLSFLFPTKSNVFLRKGLFHHPFFRLKYFLFCSFFFFFFFQLNAQRNSVLLNKELVQFSKKVILQRTGKNISLFLQVDENSDSQSQYLPNSKKSYTTAAYIITGVFLTIVLLLFIYRKRSNTILHTKYKGL